MSEPEKSKWQQPLEFMPAFVIAAIKEYAIKLGMVPPDTQLLDSEGQLKITRLTAVYMKEVASE